MKIIIQLLNYLFGFLIFLLLASSIYGENLLKNSSFEDYYDDSWSTNSSSINFNFSDNNVKVGSTSAFLKNTSTRSYGIEQSVENIKPNSGYKISGYIFASEIPDKIYIRVAWYESVDATGSQISTEDTETIEIANKWNLVEKMVISPEKANSAQIRVLLSEGDVYADYIFFEEFNKATNTPSPKPTNQIVSTTPAKAITQTPTPTTTQENIETIAGIYISEFMANPSSGENEWIEIYNSNDEMVYLEDWFYDDEENTGAQPKKFSLKIQPNSYDVIAFSSAVLNNSGDSVRLINNLGKEVDKITYQSATKDKSLGWKSLLSSEYCLQEKTPGKKNSTCIQELVLNADDTSKKTLSEKNTSITSFIKNYENSNFDKSIYEINEFKKNRYQINSVYISHKKNQKTVGDGDEIIPEKYIDTNDDEVSKMSKTLPFFYSLLSIVSITAKIKMSI